MTCCGRVDFLLIRGYCCVSVTKTRVRCCSISKCKLCSTLQPAEVAKLPRHQRAAAAPGVFDNRGRLFVRLHYVAEAKDKNGKDIFDEKTQRALRGIGKNRELAKQLPEIFTRNGERIRGMKQYNRSRNEPGL